jgi:hypothetical protein
MTNDKEMTNDQAPMTKLACFTALVIRAYVLMCFRLALRALLLAGRAPWLDFFKAR